MKAVEFMAEVGENRHLEIPEDIADQIPAGRPIRVLLLLQESSDAAWQELTTEQFLKGYAESDAIYDQLSDR